MSRKTLALALTIGLAILWLATLRWALDTPSAIAKTQTGAQSLISIGITEEIGSLDPADSHSAADWEVLYNVGSGLLSYVAGTTDLAPGLAVTMPQVSPDGLVYTFTLRPGLHFPDGALLDAYAVKWSIDRVVALDGMMKILVTDFVSETEAINGLTVRFRLKQPAAFFPQLVATPLYFPVSPDCFPAGSPDPGSTCGGLGPYKIETWTQGVSLSLQANPDFYGPPPRTPSILVRQFADSAGMRQALEQGEIDVAWRTLASEDIQALKNRPDVKVVEGKRAFIRYLCFNTTAPPYDNPTVRRAFAAALEREPVAQNVYADRMFALYSMVPEGIWSHRESFRDRFGQRDLDQARALLRQAGYSETNQLAVEFWYPPDHYGPEEPDLAAELAADLAETGLVSVSLRTTTDWPTYVSNFQSGTMPVFLLGWYADHPDPDNFTWPFAHSSSSGNLGISYSNVAMDDLLEVGRATLPMQGADRESVYVDIQDLWVDEAPTIPLLQGKHYVAAQTYVGDIIISPFGLLPFFTLGPDEGARYVALTGDDAGPNLCDDSAAPCRTVANALKWAAPGDSILVAEGTYVENILVDQPVTLKGGYEASSWTRDLTQYETTLNGSANPTVWGDWDGGGLLKPAVITDVAGYKMWFDGKDLFGQARIGVASSSDGITWTKMLTNPVLSGTPGAWDEAGQERAPFVLKEGGVYKMWYEGSSGGIRQLGYATSTNGIDWNPYSGNPVLAAGPEPFDQQAAAHGSVLNDGGVYKLWYHAIGDQGPIIAYATSPNGIDWTKQGPVLTADPDGWDSAVWGPSVLKWNGLYWMWYDGAGGYGSPAIGVVTSTNGITWTRFLTGPVIAEAAPLGDPVVINDGGIFRMWFQDFEEGVLLYAESNDGINWTQFPGNPVLTPGAPGQWGKPVLRFEPGSDGATLDGFTLTGGDADRGAGVFVDGSSVVIANAIITANVAHSDYGGGVRADNGATLLIQDALIANNLAPSAGGLAAENGSDVTLLRSDVLNNSAGSGGGGVGLWRHSSVIGQRCVIAGNVVNNDGGGVHVSDTDLDLLLDLTNCLVTGNQAYDGGAGIDNWGRVKLMNVTLADNICTGGMCVGGLSNAWSSSAATVTNSILWGNDYLDVAGWGYAVSYSDVGAASPPVTGTDNLSVDPRFVNSSSGDYHLRLDSPCLNIATGVGAPGVDFEGDLRPVGGGFDIGADETPLFITAGPDVDTSLVFTTAQGSQTTLNIPAGAVTTDTLILYTPKDPASVEAPPAGLAFAGHAFELQAFQGSTPITGFAAPVTLTIAYTDEDVQDLIESELALYRAGAAGWVKVGEGPPPGESQTLDTPNNLLTAYLRGFSRFGHFGASIQQRLYLPLVLKNG
jgi:peptide/nickel transport system substrate-binding protein